MTTQGSRTTCCWRMCWKTWPDVGPEAGVTFRHTLRQKTCRAAVSVTILGFGRRILTLEGARELPPPWARSPYTMRGSSSFLPACSPFGSFCRALLSQAAFWRICSRRFPWPDGHGRPMIDGVHGGRFFRGTPARPPGSHQENASASAARPISHRRQKRRAEWDSSIGGSLLIY